MDKNTIPFVFFGTPEYAVETLRALEEGGYLPVLVVTAPDSPQGRGMHLTPSPVKTWAENRHIPVYTPEKITPEAVGHIAEQNPVLFVVAAYGKILPPALLDIPAHGTVNVHPSLLPKYRGPAPLEAPILNHDGETGVSIILLDKEVDHGPILAQRTLTLTGNELAHDLGIHLFKEGGSMLLLLLPDLISGTQKETEQDHTKATFTKKITKEHGLVDIEKESGTELWAKFRAYTPWPGIYFFKKHPDGTRTRIKIKTAHREGEQFVIDTIIPEGKKEMAYKDYFKE